jgi:hypothetical protein
LFLTNTCRSRSENTRKVKEIKGEENDHLIATILILEKIKKLNFAKIRKGKAEENTSY